MVTRSVAIAQLHKPAWESTAYWAPSARKCGQKGSSARSVCHSGFGVAAHGSPGVASRGPLFRARPRANRQAHWRGERWRVARPQCNASSQSCQQRSVPTPGGGEWKTRHATLTLRVEGALQEARTSDWKQDKLHGRATLLLAVGRHGCAAELRNVLMTGAKAPTKQRTLLTALWDRAQSKSYIEGEERATMGQASSRGGGQYASLTLLCSCWSSPLAGCAALQLDDCAPSNVS
eukprot:1110399-Prymnesium_polylepis.1